jgi:recombination protein RecA
MGGKRVDFSIADELLNDKVSCLEVSKITGIKIGTLYDRRFDLGIRKIRGNEPIKLTQKQKEVLFGSLLGDCSLRLASKKAKNASFKEEHGIEQLDYLKHKIDIFKNLLTKDIPIIYDRFDSRFKVKEYKSCSMLSKTNPELNSFLNDFYKDGKKIVPIDLSLLTPIAIAIWFMDDGLKQGSGYGICTNSFEEKDVIRLINFLKNKYNLYCAMNAKKAIYIKACSVLDFNNLINPFIIDSMKYKIINK